MKAYTILYILIFCSCHLDAQVPQAFSFQGMAADSDGNPVKDKTVSVQISIIRGSVGGQKIYTENHQPKTNNNGVYSLSIGRGQAILGTFSSIDWSPSPIYISVSIDLTNGSDFTFVGATQILSVPYALLANEALTVKPKINVRPNPVYRPAVVINGSTFNGQGYITYNYNWIHGNPENVYVEFKGLPDDIYIYTNAIGGFGLSSTKVNKSKVDTIFDGVLEPSSFLGMKSTSTVVAPKKYPLTLEFKTSKEVLASLPFDLIVKNSEFDDCFPSLPLNKTLKSGTCPELDSFLVTNITISKYSIYDIAITNIFDDSKKDRIDFSSDPNCLIDRFVNEDSLQDYYLTPRFISYNNSAITNRFMMTNIKTGEEKTCIIRYE